MYNYDELSDVDFEYLAQDIMQKKLKLELRRFARGSDGGIDLTEDTIKRRIVVQVKHCKKSTSSQLIVSLKKELVKIKRINPERYFIVTSISLSPDKIKEIRLIFGDYIRNDRDILTIIEIDNFLQNKRNEDIVKKHFKLWFHSSVLITMFQTGDIACDSAALLSSIKANEKYFVQTKAFYDGLKVLEKTRVLLLSGAPGVGKTTTAQMLVLFFARKGFAIRYSSAVSDIGSLKRSLSEDPYKKEVILLDDCFGQLYYDMKSTQENELLLLIKFVKIMPQKVLVLNTRITILQQVRQIDYEWEKSLSNEEFKVHEINMDKMSVVEKAKILYSHMFFSEMPEKYFKEIIKNEFFFKIVDHKNYTPRIIERLTLKSYYLNITPSDYQNQILNMLNKPSLIWDNEYRFRLQQVDRIFLSTLFSITDTFIDAEMLKECFNFRLKKQSHIDLTEDHYSNCLGRLNTSMVKVIYWKNNPRISMINPSMNEYMLDRINKNPLERTEIIESIISVHQANKMLGNGAWQYLLECIRDYRIFDFVFENKKQKSDWIIQYISRYKICDEAYVQTVTDYFENMRHINRITGLRESRYEIIKSFLSEPMCEFYQVFELMKNFESMELILSDLELSELVIMVNLLIEFFKRYQDEENLLDRFIDIAATAIEKDIRSYGLHVDAAEEASGIDIERILNDCTHLDITRGNYFIDVDEAAKELGKKIEYVLHARINEELDELAESISIKVDSNIDIEFYSFELKDVIESFMYRDESEIQEDDTENEQKERDEVRFIFNR